MLRFKDLKGYAGIKVDSSNGFEYLYIVPDNIEDEVEYYEFEDKECKRLTFNKWVDEDERDNWPRISVRNIEDLLKRIITGYHTYELVDMDEVKKTVFMARL